MIQGLALPLRKDDSIITCPLFITAERTECRYHFQRFTLLHAYPLPRKRVLASRCLAMDDLSS
jgi:hypothetical protein